MASSTPRIDNLERNVIINGNFDYWQRGTSQAFTSASTSLYLADRFFTNVGTAGYTLTTSRSTDVPTYAQSLFNSVYSMLVTNGTGVAVGAADNNSIGYKVEGLDYQLLHNRKVRIQFWAKCSLTGTFTLALRGGSPLRSYVTPITFTAASTWTFFSYDIQLDTATGYSFDNSIGLRVEIYLTAGSNFQTSVTNTWQTGNFVGITGMTQWAATTGATFQLAQAMLIPNDLSIASSVAISFRRNGLSIGEELRACLRYYQKSFALNTFPANGPNGTSFATLVGHSSSAISRAGPWNGVEGYNQTISSPVRFTIPMRAAPTIVAYGNNAGNWYTFSNPTGIGYSAPIIAGITESQFHPTFGSPIGITDAETMGGGHWTADAEI